MRYDRVTDIIGNTPLLRIDPAVHGLRNIDLFAKLELLNPFGSLKDRAAWNMVRPHLDAAVAGNRQVVELSSGNTAKALALIAGMHGLAFKSVTNRMRVPEIKDLLLLLGAEIEELPGRSECLDPTDTEDPLTQFHRELLRPGTAYLHTDQYYNPRNAAAHATGTGPEILADLDDRAPDWFISCVGTAGSSTGVAEALRRHNPDLEVVGLVAHKSDFVPGIRNIDEVQEVGLFDPENYHSITPVTSQEAIDGMLALIRTSGVLSGPTGGAAYFGALRHLRPLDRELTERRTAVFIVCDRVENYLGYLRTRRPELFGAPPRPGSVSAVTEEDAARAAVVDVGEAQTWMEKEDPLVVDLRSPFAYAALHIEGSVNIADEIFEELVRNGLPFSKSKPVLLACPIGEKSARYAALLTRLGHPDARSLTGGIVAWRDAGAPLVRE